MTTEQFRRIEFWLPLPPNVANARGHWAKLRRERNVWTTAATIEMCRQNVTWPRHPWDRTRLQCHFYLWNTMDEDNLAARQKPILDLLKGRHHNGFFPDDKPRHLELLPPTQTIDRKHQRVVVVLERLNDVTG